MLRIENVSKTYQNGVRALKNVSFQIDKGEFVFIVGSSGSGKTTLIKLLMKELDPNEGKIIVNGNNVGEIKRHKITKLRRSIGVVFQDFRLLNKMTVFENVAFALLVTGHTRRYIRKNVPVMLSLVGLSKKSKMYPNQLSGGEQQRVALARALINNPPVLLADEPTGNLDPNTALEIMALLMEINKRGTTVVVVTHNKEIVNTMKKRVITLHEGNVVRDELLGGYHHEA